MILNKEKPKEFTKITVRTNLNEFYKVAGYKINILKPTTTSLQRITLLVSRFPPISPTPPPEPRPQLPKDRARASFFH